MASRIFTDAEVGIILTLTCDDSDDTESVFAEVIEKNPVIVTTDEK